jgi:hypothetical protein
MKLEQAVLPNPCLEEEEEEEEDIWNFVRQEMGRQKILNWMAVSISRIKSVFN